MNTQVLLFDLDGTLLRNDKSISSYTLNTLTRCRKKGILLGISTSRSEKNTMKFISELVPDILIVSGGALASYQNSYFHIADFSVDETQRMIKLIRSVCGSDCEITIDTLHEHYWNYKILPEKNDTSWGESIYTDFSVFNERALKIYVEVSDYKTASRLSELLPNCDCAKFSDSNWYKFTHKIATKEIAIQKFCSSYHIPLQNIISFGDDLVDIGMLKLCGTGIAKYLETLLNE